MCTEQATIEIPDRRASVQGYSQRSEPDIPRSSRFHQGSGLTVSISPSLSIIDPFNPPFQESELIDIKRHVFIY